MQLAADERFQNVFLDRRVIGDRYVVSDVSPGYYHWRVAPADFSQVGDFSRPVKIFISGGMIIPVKLPDTRATSSHSSRANIGRKIR